MDKHVKELMDNYLDREHWIFTYHSYFIRQYISLKHIISIGDLYCKDSGYTGGTTNKSNTIVEVFTTGGLMALTVSQSSSGPTAAERNYHQAFLESWKEYKRYEAYNSSASCNGIRMYGDS